MILDCLNRREFNSRLEEYNRRNVLIKVGYYFLEKFYLKDNKQLLEKYDEVVIVHNGDLGDLVIILSVLTILKRHTDKPIRLYTKKSNKTLKDIIPEYIKVNFSELEGAGRSEQVLDLMRDRAINRLLFITHRFNPSVLRYILASKNVEIHAFRSILGALNIVYGKSIKEPSDTEIKAICRLLRTRFPEMPLADFIPLEEPKKYAHKKTSFGIIHPFSREKSKWMSFSTIVQILNNNKTKFYLVGNGDVEARHARDIIEQLPNSLKSKIINKVSKLNVAQLVTCLRASSSVHCTDSFVCHLAASYSREINIYVNSKKNNSFLPKSDNVKIIHET